MPSSHPDGKPFDASFSNSDRYARVKESVSVTVLVEGSACQGEIVARNGPRTQVRYEHGGHVYVRWFDADKVFEDPPG